MKRGRIGITRFIWGVTEAGDGEDGRIKSAIGIGSLLSDGLGDTIRVSLTEDAVYEIPVARALVNYVNRMGQQTEWSQEMALSFDPFTYVKRNSACIQESGVAMGGEEPTRVYTTQEKYEVLKPRLAELEDTAPEVVYEDSGVVEVNLEDTVQIEELNRSGESNVGHRQGRMYVGSYNGVPCSGSKGSFASSHFA